MPYTSDIGWGQAWPVLMRQLLDAQDNWAQRLEVDEQVDPDTFERTLTITLTSNPSTDS